MGSSSDGSRGPMPAQVHVMSEVQSRDIADTAARARRVYALHLSWVHSRHAAYILISFEIIWLRQCDALTATAPWISALWVRLEWSGPYTNAGMTSTGRIRGSLEW